MAGDSVFERVADYYSGRYAEHGATARGVDWNSAESQELRFVQLLRVADGCDDFSIVDYGCGYGALAGFLERSGRSFAYVGHDVSTALLERASRDYAASARCRFVAGRDELRPADFAVASGIFNVKLDVAKAVWERHVLETLDRLDRLGTRGVAFNMLTSYSDRDRMRPDLYYAAPEFFFGRCKRRYARNVALLHDYGLYEFTILIRKEPSP